MSFSILRRWCFASLALTVGYSASALAAYPDKPVKLVVSYPAGGPTDLIARKLAQKLSQTTGATFIVYNKGGAGGNIGARDVVNAAPDGYTLLFLVVGHTINMSLYRHPGFDVQKDLAPVTPVASSPLILLANAKMPVHNVAELLSLFKSNPGKYTYGSAGVGSAPHLAMELLKQEAGLDIMHVPFRGGAPALNALMAGETSIMFDSMVTGSQATKNDRIRALATTGAKRSAIVPDIPTLGESALPGYKAITWYGIAAPKGTPDKVVEWLNTKMSDALRAPDIQKQFSAWGADTMQMAPKEFGNFIASETEKWGKIVKDTGASAE